jgi:hypothetical protein
MTKTRLTFGSSGFAHKSPISNTLARPAHDLDFLRLQIVPGMSYYGVHWPNSNLRANFSSFNEMFLTGAGTRVQRLDANKCGSQNSWPSECSQYHLEYGVHYIGFTTQTRTFSTFREATASTCDMVIYPQLFHAKSIQHC